MLLASVKFDTSFLQHNVFACVCMCVYVCVSGINKYSLDVCKCATGTFAKTTKYYLQLINEAYIIKYINKYIMRLIL